MLSVGSILYYALKGPGVMPMVFNVHFSNSKWRTRREIEGRKLICPRLYIIRIFEGLKGMVRSLLLL